MLECQKIKEENESEIIKKKGVVGVGIGQKWVNGLPQADTQSILVFVEKKRTRRGVIQKFSLEDVIPDNLNGIPTDVIEVGKIVKHGFTQRTRPVKPGYSCSHKQVTAGTIGGFFLDADGDIVILSNNHVLANENKANAGDIIFQPGTYDSSGNLEFKGWNEPLDNLPYIATLKKYVQLNKDNNFQDSAIAKIANNSLIDPAYPLVNGPCIGFGNSEIGQQVQKFGRTTGYTTGRVIGTNASFTVGYDFGPATFNDCVVCTNMSKSGDSGSLIMDMQMNAVAHLFAGSPKVTIANPIKYAVNEYGLRPYIKDQPSNKSVSGFGKGQWKQHSSSGKITIENGAMVIESPANQFCFIESNLQKFRSVSATINTKDDKGATWGPGIAIQFPNGIIKVNLRHGHKFGGYFNGTEYLNIGSVKENTEYVVRIRQSDNGTYVGEVNDGGRWYTVIELPVSIFQQPAMFIRIGKTDMLGQPSNHTSSGDNGTCVIRDFKLD